MKYFFINILQVLSFSFFSINAFAICVRIITTNTYPVSNYYTEPGKGTVNNWSGATDSSGTMGTTPRMINVTNNDFQPLGSLIATGYVSFLESGSSRYDPEQILFRCSADEESSLREFYATNGDSSYAGRYLVNSALGLNETYTTIIRDVGIRVKNLSTGEYFSRYWKSRPLKNLDKDSRGWLLVKAKNFSDASIELFKINYTPRTPLPISRTGVVIWSQPSAYIAFKSKMFSLNLSDGADSLNHHGGFHTQWPGAISLHRNIVVNRTATCILENLTPHVSFPRISKHDLNNNMKVTAPINIRFKCQSGEGKTTGFFSGMENLQTVIGFLPKVANTAAAKTAIGFLPKIANIAAAKRENLIVSSGTGVTHLLSDGYGSMPNIATGVGIRLYQTNGNPLNFISSLSSIGQGSANGWYSILNNALLIGQANGTEGYSTTINASLEKLPGKTATAGKFDASLQVIIQVQ